MVRLLTPLLSAADLPLAELCAARLDGEVFAVDDCFATIDEIDDRLLRAGALAHEVPSRAIVERESALWVYGVLAAPPTRHTLCVGLAGGSRIAPSPRWLVRECRLDEHDVETVAGIRVVTVLHAAVDLLRAPGSYGAEQRRRIRALMALGGFDEGACADRLGVRPSVPGTRLARQRLAA